MSLITAKKIFEIYNINIEKKEVPKRIYIIFQKSLVKRIEKKIKLKKIDFARGDLYFSENNDFGIITNFGSGFSASLMLAEELSVLGVKEIVAIGMGGYILSEKEKGVKIGDIFLVDNIFSQVDLGYLYNQKEEKTTTSLKLNNEFSGLKKKNTISVISLYRENESILKKVKDEKISLIEMEAYPLSLVFESKKIEFSQIIGVSDILKNNKWEFKKENIKIVFDSLEKYFFNHIKNI